MDADRDTCACGHVRDEHEQGRNKKYPGSDKCTIKRCECLGFEEEG